MNEHWEFWHVSNISRDLERDSVRVVFLQTGAWSTYFSFQKSLTITSQPQPQYWKRILGPPFRHWDVSWDCDVMWAGSFPWQGFRGPRRCHSQSCLGLPKAFPENLRAQGSSTDPPERERWELSLWWTSESQHTFTLFLKYTPQTLAHYLPLAWLMPPFSRVQLQCHFLGRHSCTYTLSQVNPNYSRMKPSWHTSQSLYLP